METKVLLCMWHAASNPCRHFDGLLGMQVSKLVYHYITMIDTMQVTLVGSRQTNMFQIKSCGMAQCHCHPAYHVYSSLPRSDLINPPSNRNEQIVHSNKYVLW